MTEHQTEERIYYKMDLAVVQILLLSQEDCSLEEHTESFIGLVYLVSSDDDSLCVFF